MKDSFVILWMQDDKILKQEQIQPLLQRFWPIGIINFFGLNHTKHLLRFQVGPQLMNGELKVSHD